MLQRGIPAGDSGELIAVAHTLGTAHPPGYPLWTLLAFAWEHVVPLGSVVFRTNLFSAVAAALAAATLAWTVTRLAASLAGGPWAGAAAGFALAFAPPLFKNALVAEVFALHALLAALALLAFVAFLRARGERRAPDGPLAALALLGGLQVAHHHSLVLLWLPLALATAWLLARRADRAPRPTRRGALGATAAFVAGLAPVAWLPLAASRVPPAAFSWGDPTTPGRLWRVLTRADYGTFRLDPAEAGHVADRSHVVLWLESLPRDFGAWGVGLALAGLVVLARTPRGRPLAGALAGFVVLQAAFFTRVNFPTTPEVFRGVVERFYVLPAVVMALLVGVGVSALHGAVARRLGRTAAIAFGLLAVAMFVAPLVVGGRRAALDQSRNRFVDELADGVLASTPPGAVLFVQGDLFHNALAVKQKVEGVRPDETVVDQELLTYAWHVARLRRADPSLLPERLGAGDRYDGTPASGNGRWIEHLLPRRPVAFLGLKEASYAERYALVPMGYVLWAAAKESAAAETPAARARTALAIFQGLRFDAAFRSYDPWSFEAAERARMTECIARTTRLLCVPGVDALTPGNTPGFRELLAVLERSRAVSGDGEDPEVVRARGYLYALHPAVRDRALAEADLGRVLAREPAGPRAEEARRVLAWVRGLPVAASRPPGP